MKNNSITYLVTVEYERENRAVVTCCDFVTLTDESDMVDIKEKIREDLYIPYAAPVKIISMCPMLHLDLEA